MAVIKRDVLYGQAKEIADKAISSARVYDSNLIALQQQRDVLDSQQQSLVSSTQSTLKTVSQNIYQAKRQAKAASASLGLIGDLAASRNQQSLQTDIHNELSNVIDQAEQGAITIAGQQSAINKAEVQYAQDAILSEYADTLIDEGNVAISRDYGREALAGFTGALSGGFMGFLGGKAFNWGTKTLVDPTSGWFKKGLASSLLTLLPVIGAHSIYNMTTDEESQLAKDVFNYGGLSLGLGGLATGVSLAAYDKSRINDIASIWGGDYLKNGVSLSDLAKQTTTGTNQLLWSGGQKRAKRLLGASIKETAETAVNAVEKSALQLAQEKGLVREARRLAKLEASAQQLVGTQRISSVSNAGAKAFGTKMKRWFGGKTLTGQLQKLNIATTIISTSLGAILGGVNGATKQRYRLDLNKLMNQDTAQQFANFGLDLDALTDKVYNEYRRTWD